MACQRVSFLIEILGSWDISGGPYGRLSVSSSDGWKDRGCKQSLGDLLRSLVTEHHSHWDHILPQAKFTYKDSLNISTGQSPFQIVYGMQPRGISELKDAEQAEVRSASAEDFAEGMKDLHSRVKERLQSSSQEYKRRADKPR
jgi:hypothetical protein